MALSRRNFILVGLSLFAAAMAGFIGFSRQIKYPLDGPLDHDELPPDGPLDHDELPPGDPQRLKYSRPYYKPKLVLATLLPAQREFADKFGGLPWGLPAEMWPCCRDCHKPLSLIAQLQHHEDRLNLGKTGRVLHLFLCRTINAQVVQGTTKDSSREKICDILNTAGGSNKVLIIEPEIMRDGLTPAPANANPPMPEARVLKWSRRYDVGPDDPKGYFDEELYAKRGATSWLNGAMAGWKLGGFPHWRQSPEGPPVPPWQFTMLVPDYFDFYGPLPNPAFLHNAHMVVHRGPAKQDVSVTIVNPVGEYDYDVTPDQWFCGLELFGGGLGYVFTKVTPEKAEGVFLFQR